MYLDKDFLFIYLFLFLMSKRSCGVANSQCRNVNDITQSQTEGFGDKRVNCSGMTLLKTEFILFIFCNSHDEILS